MKQAEGAGLSRAEFSHLIRRGKWSGYGKKRKRRKSVEENEVKKVYQAIVNVASDISKEGIAKDKTCTQGASYKFRGIDDIYNALSPFLAKHRLCILPRMINKVCVERASQKGNALFYTTVEAEFDFVSAEDGSMHTVKTYGEAMDSGDKSTNKAMSAAYKYAAFQSFCIPTEGDNDSENQTHEVKKTSSQKRNPLKAENKCDNMIAEANKNAATLESLGKWYETTFVERKKLPASEMARFNSHVAQLKESLLDKVRTGKETECPESGMKVFSDECQNKPCRAGCPAFE
jgi:hypothetical protein